MNYQEYAIEHCKVFLKQEPFVCPLFFYGLNDNGYIEVVSWLTEIYDLARFLTYTKLICSALEIKSGVVFYQASLSTLKQENTGLYIGNVTPDVLTMSIFKINNDIVEFEDLAKGKGQLDSNDWAVIEKVYDAEDVEESQQALKILKIDYNNLLNRTSIVDFSV